MYAPTTGSVVVNRVTDPYSLALTTNSERSVLVDLDARALKPAGWNRLQEAQVAQAGVLDHLRAPRPRLLDQRRDGARGPSRQLPGLHRSRQRRHAAPSSAGPVGAEYRAPAAGERHRHHRGAASRAAAAGLRLGQLPAGQRGAAGMRRRHRRRGRLQLGLRPAALHDPGGLLRHESGGRRADRGVPPDGAGHQPGRAAGGHRRGLQPHPGRRSGPEVDLGPGGSRLLPAALADRSGRDLHLLRQYRDRARHDGKTDDRVRGHLGQGLQGRRVPLRSDGSPAQVGHAEDAARAEQAHPGQGRGRRQGHLPLRRGLELRRSGRTTPASCRPASSRWPAPGSAPSTTGCGTPYAAVGRSTRTRGSKASPPASTPTPTATRSTAPRRRRRVPCCSTRTGSRSG